MIRAELRDRATDPEEEAPQLRRAVWRGPVHGPPDRLTELNIAAVHGGQLDDLRKGAEFAAVGVPIRGDFRYEHAGRVREPVGVGLDRHPKVDLAVVPYDQGGDDAAEDDEQGEEVTARDRHGFQGSRGV